MHFFFLQEFLVELPFWVSIFDRLYSLITYKGNKHIHINFAKRQFNYIVFALSSKDWQQQFNNTKKKTLKQ